MPSFNLFDLAVYICLALAFVMGFSSGLLRSLATIFAYVAGLGITVAAAPPITRFAAERLPGMQAWIVLIAVYLLASIIVGAVLRYVISEIAGPDISAADRVLGAVLGIIRILFVAVLIVVIFDRIIPSGREPSFLVGSRLRPILSEAGRQGLRKLPPDIEDYIDRLKRERGL